MRSITKNNKLRWRRGLFNCTFKLFSGAEPIGHLRDSEFSRSAEGKLNDKRYRFTTRGLFRSRTEIVDIDQNAVVGDIRYSCWYPKAYINFRGKETQWKYSNLWETRWKIFGQDGIGATFSGYETKGSIHINQLDEGLVLAGLYISNYYWRLVAIMIAVFIPALFVAM